MSKQWFWIILLWSAAIISWITMANLQNRPEVPTAMEAYVHCLKVTPSYRDDVTTRTIEANCAKLAGIKP